MEGKLDENSAVIEAILREELENNGGFEDHNSGWQTVTYSKRNRKRSEKPPEVLADRPNGGTAGDSNGVFWAIEQQSEERRRRAEEAKKAAVVEPVARSKQDSDGDEDDSEGEASGDVDNGGAEVKKPKAKKPKKPKVTVGEAAAKIDPDGLAFFLAEISESYGAQHDIQLMRFADYFGRAFSSVSGAQFPWMKTLKESSVAKMVDIPLSHLPEAVYKTSVDWISKRSFEALGPFVLWSLDGILADLASHQGPAKGSKKVVQQMPSKSQVAIFVVLAMVLRRKPDVLISLVPLMKENPKYQGQDKLPVIVWVIAQACQGDLTVGLYMWVRILLPILSSKSSSNPQSRDLILQLAERILSLPKARPILLNGSVKKGERLVPPSALELLMRISFTAPSARVKATERFQAVYPTLKDVALAGTPGSKTMKLLSLQIFPFAIKAAGEGLTDLSKEAGDICIWCLTQNPSCYKQWDNIYLDNLEASVVILRKLSDGWKGYSRHHALDVVRETLKSFRQKNEKALATVEDTSRQKSLKDVDRSCKAILAQLSRGNTCLKSAVFVSAALAVGAVLVSQNMQPGDLQKFYEMFWH
ncbi:uncharacterized protein LOC131159515 [Malania oleifera]|uniref:uncharacterized protein LOC131159515 n=1 Tax=Malania oleifera TaxID=397392 RepID=UPI0025AD9D33|nr:uncharacterized protein LOC131159515 [Malania oleifera]